MHTFSPFEILVFQAVKKIPKGQTQTYKQIAHEIDRPNSFRAVGNALNKNYDPKVPCHRVVRSDGKIGGYNRGSKEKSRRLKREFML
ncbi:MAG: MGMT family protein [Candidatus Moranbacteria bacterium]|nr:MGMT family protein [Candidatus Moranbacteria bacterium]